MAKLVKLTPVTFELTCPHCGEDVPQPKTGSLFWTGQELDEWASHTTACTACGKDFSFPKRKP